MSIFITLAEYIRRYYQRNDFSSHIHFESILYTLFQYSWQCQVYTLYFHDRRTQRVCHVVVVTAQSQRNFHINLYTIRVEGNNYSISFYRVKSRSAVCACWWWLALSATLSQLLEWKNIYVHAFSTSLLLAVMVVKVRRCIRKRHICIIYLYSWNTWPSMDLLLIQRAVTARADASSREIWSYSPPILVYLLLARSPNPFNQFDGRL